MNGSIIRYILGLVIRIECLLLLVPCFVGFLYDEPERYSYMFVAIICFVVGTVLTIVKPKENVFHLKEGCVTTALSWIILSAFGAVPFLLTGEMNSFTDAMFETVSGFTTTGASILNDVEALSYASLMWRSLTHWVGGMGVLVFVLAVIPLTGGSNINLMRAESPGPSVGKLAPKVKSTARILYGIYFGMTALEMVMLLIAGMPLFDSVATAFATAGTGGFGIKNDSITSYSASIQWIVTIFMIAFGVNFNFYYFVLFRHFKKALHMEEVRTYIGIIIASIAIIAWNIYETSTGIAKAILDAAFQVGSIITTTGFSTANFDTWPALSKSILVLLMFVGACAGSTGGGVKVSRFIILFKTFVKEANSYMHPKSYKKINMDGKPIDHDVVRSTNVYIITFFTIFVTSVLLVSIEGRDVVTNFTAVAATVNNIGPGLAQVGPTQNFALFSIFSKWVLIFDMLAGRLELFPLIILFHPGIWREAWDQRKKKIQR
ncbi:MAG: TrkH family potassium uptake protein [Lachnospiraceae bacterium]|nr:TrkH family potassium uptake protein [Lachnospiraceae bacterium]